MSFVVRTTTRFALFQALEDLRRIAEAATEATLARILGLIPVDCGPKDLKRVIGPQRCRLFPDDIDDLHPCLLLAATLPQDDHSAFVTATAILLADRLQAGAGPDPLHHHWDSVRASYALAPRPIETALLRAFALLQAQGRISLDAPPSAKALIQGSDRAVLDQLVRLAREMGPDVLHRVAQLDGAASASGHRMALRRILAGLTHGLPDCGQSDVRFVIETASRRPGPGFAPCTALILIEAIRHCDAKGLAAERWTSLARAYRRLVPAESEPILSGFRYLWETCPGWTPYTDWSDAQIQTEGIAIPLKAR